MPHIDWEPGFTVHVEALDDEHRQLIDLINRLHEAMARGEGQAGTGVVLRGMTDYAHRHFMHEERLMAEVGFPGAARHRAEHEKFVERLREMTVEHNRRQVAVSVDLLDFLKSWLVHHIRHSDQQYRGYFNRHGLR